MSIKNIKRNLIITFDKATARKATISIGDILHLRTTIEHNQFLAISRLLDIEDYTSQKDVSFKRQNTFSYADYGEKHQREKGDESFRRLIESYKKEGYNSNSFFTVDSEIRLLDGNHRMGMNLFYHIHEINANVILRKSRLPRGLDWYFEKRIDKSIIDEVRKKYTEVTQDLIEEGDCFCAIVNGEDVLNDLQCFVTIQKTDTLDNGFIECDEKGLIDLSNKLLVRFTINNPQYIVHNSKLYSRRTREIQNIICKRYNSLDAIAISDSCLDGIRIFEMCRKYII